MLQRFVGIVLGDRTIVVVMVALFLPVECRMSDFFRLGECGRLPSDGNGLPKYREQQEKHCEAPTHAKSLAEASAYFGMPMFW